MSPRLSLLATLALVVPACGGEQLDPDAEPASGADCGCVDSPDAAPDAPPPDAEPPDPCAGEPGEDPTYLYVIDSVNLPTNASEADALGMDLDGDGTIDNQLGNILSALASAGGPDLDPQDSMDTSVDEGATILLARLQPCGATGRSFATYQGENPNPPACTGPSDTECRGHLQGGATFDLAADTPLDNQVAGALAGDEFTGGPGELTFAMTMGIGAPVTVELVGARVRITAVSTTSFASSVIAGAVPDAQIQAQVLPAIHASVAAQIAADCTGGVAPECGCVDGSTGETFLGIFDEDSDCDVELAEVQDNSLIQTLLRPDIDTDGDGTADALSMGVGVTATYATFTVPEAP